MKTDTSLIAEKPLTSTMEDYLEAIYDLDADQKVVRVRDLARRLEVKMPTVTSMLKTLNDRGLVNYEKYEYIALTESGAGVGREMHRRHRMLFQFLSSILKIEKKTADAEACKMEHTLSESTLARLTDFMEFIQACPRAGDSWLRYFEEFRKFGRRSEKCQACAAQFPCALQSTQKPSEG